MGISLKDFGSFAVGAINEDKRLTKEKFDIRKEELIANRNALIENRKKKYELEIKEFEEQNKKNTVVKSLNAKYADFKTDDGKVSQEGAIAWGRDFLLDTNPTLFTSLSNHYKDRPNELNKALANYSKRYTDFGVTGTRDDLFKTQEDDISRITTEYGEKLKNAKGDSFLINKLVGERNDKISTINNKTNIGAEKSLELDKEANITEPPKEKTGLTFAKVEDKPYISDTFKKKAIKDIEEVQKTDYSSKQYNKQSTELFLTFIPGSKIKDYFSYDAKKETYTAKPSIVNADSHIQSLIKNSISELSVGALHTKAGGNNIEKINLNKNTAFDNAKRHTDQYGSWVVDGAVLAKRGSLANLFKKTNSALVVAPQSIIDINNNTLKGYENIYIPPEFRKGVGDIYTNSIMKAANQRQKTASGTLEDNINAIQRNLSTENAGNSSLAKEIRKTIATSLYNVQNSKGESLYPTLNPKPNKETETEEPPKSTGSIFKVPVGKMRVKAPDGRIDFINDTTENRKKAIEKGGTIIQSAQEQDVPQEDGITNFELQGMDKSLQAGKIRSATADAKRLGIINTNMTPKQRKEVNEEMRKVRAEARAKKEQEAINKELGMVKPIKSVG
tara:strand:+ start:52 stop:1902 length:1851 start_codon:yes stop_codon:yes gene_type:complete